MKRILSLSLGVIALYLVSACAHKEAAPTAEAAPVTAEAAKTCDEKHAGHDHTHGKECGHESVQHDGHVDYKHDGHQHNVHADHVDEHGKVATGESCSHAECKCKGKCSKMSKACKSCKHCSTCHKDGSKCPGPSKS